MPTFNQTSSTMEIMEESFYTFYQTVYPRWYLDTVARLITTEEFIVNTAPILNKLLSVNKDDVYQYPLINEEDLYSSVDISDLDSSWREFICKIYHTPHLTRTNWIQKKLYLLDDKSAFKCLIDETFPGFSGMSWVLNEDEYDRFVREIGPKLMDKSTEYIRRADEICYNNFKTNKQKIDFFIHFNEKYKYCTRSFLESIDYEESDFYRQFANDHEGLLKEI